jgi:hypothetical protein
MGGTISAFPAQHKMPAQCGVKKSSNRQLNKAEQKCSICPCVALPVDPMCLILPYRDLSVLPQALVIRLCGALNFSN